MCAWPAQATHKAALVDHLSLFSIRIDSAQFLLHSMSHGSVLFTKIKHCRGPECDGETQTEQQVYSRLGVHIFCSVRVAY